jgi:predicted phosphohydrolase
MAKLYAMADLHLSLNGDKPMHVFGELWRDHTGKMAAAWDDHVEPQDTVLLAGDLSWGRKAAEAAPDLAWIGDRPGHKLLLRGNHDSWWSGAAKVRAALPPGCEILHNDSHEVGPWIVVGARGWTDPDDPIAQPGDARIFERELSRLRLSIEDADRRFGRGKPRLAMAHFPPWLLGREAGAVVASLREAGVTACVYGHLHGEDHALARTGRHGGIRFHFVAVDAVGFAPVEIPGPVPA